MDVLSGTTLSRQSHGSGSSHRFCAGFEHLHLLSILLFKREVQTPPNATIKGRPGRTANGDRVYAHNSDTPLKL